MHDVERGSRRGGVGDDLLKGSERSSGALSPQVDVDRDVLIASDLEEPKDLFAGRAGRVGDTEAEAEAPFFDPAHHERFQFRELLGGRRLVGVVGHLHETLAVFVGLVAERPASDVDVVEELRARGQMADRRAVMNDGLPFARGEPRGDGVDANLHLERGRDAVLRLEAVTDRVLTVRVEVDEAGRHDEPGSIHHDRSLERSFADRDDGAPFDAHVPHGVEPGFRVHHPAALEDDLDREKEKRRQVHLRVTQI